MVSSVFLPCLKPTFNEHSFTRALFSILKSCTFLCLLFNLCYTPFCLLVYMILNWLLCILFFEEDLVTVRARSELAPGSSLPTPCSFFMSVASYKYNYDIGYTLNCINSLRLHILVILSFVYGFPLLALSLHIKKAVNSAKALVNQGTCSTSVNLNEM